MSATIEPDREGTTIVFGPELYVEEAAIQRAVDHEGKPYTFTPIGVVASMGGDDQFAYVRFQLGDQKLGGMRIPWSAIRAALAARPEGRR